AGDLDGAISWRGRAVERRRRILAADQAPVRVDDFLSFIAELRVLAVYHHRKGNLREGLELAEEALRVGQGVEPSLRSQSWLFRMRDAYATLGEIHRLGGDREGELEAARLRLGIGEEWTQTHEPGRDVLWAAAGWRLELANLLLKDGQDEEALAETRKALGEI